MRSQDWDPKTFFAMHDLNGDRFWDEDEVRVSSNYKKTNQKFILINCVETINKPFIKITFA